MAEPIVERVKSFEKEFSNLLNKYNLDWNVVASFPVYNILPSEVKLALIVLEKHGVEYRLSYSDKKQV